MYEFQFKPAFVTLCLRKKNVGFTLKYLRENYHFNTGGILIKGKMKILDRLT
jgi:hypothetical protein